MFVEHCKSFIFCLCSVLNWYRFIDVRIQIDKLVAAFCEICYWYSPSLFYEFGYSF